MRDFPATIPLMFTGCASLILRDNDTAGETTGNVMARILLAIPDRTSLI
jgi:hypothetical protein